MKHVEPNNVNERIPSTKTFSWSWQPSTARIKIYFGSGKLPLLCFDISSVLWDKALMNFLSSFDSCRIKGVKLDDFPK